jgi:two-component sensor histidine kinase
MQTTNSLLPDRVVSLIARLRAGWLYVTMPSIATLPYEDRLKSQWLTALLLILMPLGFILSGLTNIVPTPGTPFWNIPGIFPPLICISCLAPFYILIRRGHYQSVAGFAVIVCTAAIFLAIWLDTDLTSKALDCTMLLMPMLFAGIMLGWKAMLVVIASDNLGLLALSLFDPGLPIEFILSGPFNVIILGSALNLLGMRLRDKLERHHTGELTAINAMLQAEIVERKKAEEQIHNVLREKTALLSEKEAALQEKEILLKEIHHRVKNNLQIIASLLSLQSAKFENAELLAQYQDSQNRIRSMALIHERLYRSSDLAHIDFGNYLRELTGSLTQSFRQKTHGITLQLQADPILLDIDAAIPCGLLVNELVSNAFKHAFPGRRQGIVSVELRCGPAGQLRLAVQDDGVGFPAGLDFQHTESLGLQLVNSLTRQLDGVIELQRDPGTAFIITFTSPTSIVASGKKGG